MLRSDIEDVLRANGMDIPVEKPKQDAAAEIAPVTGKSGDQGDGEKPAGEQHSG
jgi:hypothetical protein